MNRIRAALVLLDGDAPSRAELDRAWPGWDADVDLVVAADGGARLADALGLHIDQWVGDGDSLGSAGLDALRATGTPIDLASTDKDESDAELGLLAALVAGAREVRLIGALGGAQPDHALANIGLLGHPAAAGREVVIVDPTARIHQVGPVASIELPGRVGDLVSILPLEPAVGVTTAGLAWALSEATLDPGRTRGLSNVRVAPVARIAIRGGRILVVESPATLLP
jgi:thiamine pyrophosphokinase